jgi:hypothetical protein
VLRSSGPGHGYRTSPPTEQVNDEDRDFLPAVTLLTPLHLTSDLPATSPGRCVYSQGRPSISDTEAGHTPDIPHSAHTEKTGDFAWGANASINRGRQSHGERSPRIIFRDTASPSQYPRSPSSVTASSIRNDISASRLPSGVTIYPHSDYRQTSLEASEGALDTTFLRPYGSTAIPRMSSFSSVATSMSSDAALGVLSSPLIAAFDPSAERYTSPLSAARGSHTRQLAVVSQEETNGQVDNHCPVCVESLDASFRLPGEKSHIIPECGHVIHEVSLSCCLLLGKVTDKLLAIFPGLLRSCLRPCTQVPECKAQGYWGMRCLSFTYASDG